jgi:hypothetical protein
MTKNLVTPDLFGQEPNHVLHITSPSPSNSTRSQPQTDLWPNLCLGILWNSRPSSPMLQPTQTTWLEFLQRVDTQTIPIMTDSRGNSPGLSKNNSVARDVIHWICFRFVSKRIGHTDYKVLRMSVVVDIRVILAKKEWSQEHSVSGRWSRV